MFGYKFAFTAVTMPAMVYFSNAQEFQKRRGAEKSWESDRR